MKNLFTVTKLDAKPSALIARSNYRGVTREFYTDAGKLYIRLGGKEYAQADCAKVAEAIAAGDVKHLNEKNKLDGVATADNYSKPHTDIGGGLKLNGNASAFIGGDNAAEPNDIVAQAL